jgi:WD40 repeat protein
MASGAPLSLRVKAISENDQPAPELVLQTGHGKLVGAVVFSPDKQWVASGSFDNTVKLWETETGRELRSLQGHTGAVKALDCSPDGTSVASGGNDRSLRLWDVRSGNATHSFSPNVGTIEAVTFTPDGAKLAVAGSDGVVVLVDASTGQEAVRLLGHSASVGSLRFSPDGQWLASGGSDGSLFVWDVAKGKAKFSLIGQTNAVTALRFSPSGELLASGSQDGSVRLWKVTTGRKTTELRGDSAQILSFQFLTEEKVISADSERSIKSWTVAGAVATPSVVGKAVVDASAGDAKAGAFSADGSYFVTGNGGGTLTLIDARSGRILRSFENHTSGYYGVAFSPDRRWLASASFDNTVKLWDLQTGESVAPLLGHTGRVRSIAFHPDSSRFITGSSDHTIRIWDAISRRSLGVLQGHTNSISSVSIGGKGTLIASGSTDQMVGVWDIDAKKPPRFLAGHKGEVTSVAVSSDERLIVSGGVDGTVKIWDPATGALVGDINTASGEIDSVSISPDGKFIASGGVDRTVRIWETDSGRLVRSMAGHSAKINTVSFSPDGLRIASSGQDKTVRLWNVDDGRAVYTMNGHAGTVFSISFSVKGGWLASAGDDGTLNIWNIETGNRRATLISLKNSSDWLVVTPDGFFDGSAGAWNQLSWRFQLDTFNVQPVEVFFSEFYVPGLLTDVMNDRPLPSTSSISVKDRRQPDLSISASTPKPSARDVSVKIDVSKAPGGAKDVRLFRNGALVRVWRGDVLNGKGAVSLETTVPIVSGENRLTAYAFNRDDVKSRDATLSITGDRSLDRKGVSYILAIGVNEYTNSEYNLSQAVRDARDFADELERQQKKLGNSERIDVTILPDARATKSGIITALSDISAKIRPEDSLTIFFAGHGVAVENRFYLVPHDLGYEGSRTNQGAAGLQIILDHSISDDELNKSVEGIDARQVILVIDACNSGQVLESTEKRRGPMNSKGLAQLAYEKGMYILTASQSYQAAKEDEKLGHGYLTYALIEEGLKTSAADRTPKDGQILVREWLDFATERVPQIDQEEINKVEKRARKLEREKGKAVGQGDDGSIQRPRVFYRREEDIQPVVIARP